jgi:alkylation response protein AidB-like acyl-CoA dehydrogenase
VQFSFSDQQLEFRDQMRAFAEKECPPSAVRDAYSSMHGWSESRWAALAELGVTGLTVPEAHGGLGLGQVDLASVLEEAGKACLPEPLIETVAVGVPLLSECGSPRAEELRARWMNPAALGEAVIIVGLSPSSAVSAASGADLLLLEHRVAGASEVHAVEAGQVHLEPRPSLDAARRLSAIEWEPSPATLVASGGEASSLLDHARIRGANATSAMLLGLADRMISMAAQHAVDRKQFGKAIGTFQAVKHHLANALVRLEFSRPVVYAAAWSIDSRDNDAKMRASMAKAQASESALLAARVALQVHGAIGYTLEHDLQLWMKRAWVLASAWGDAATHRARVLDWLVTGDS